MRALWLAALLALLCMAVAKAAEQDEIFSIYLVRHAEKAVGGQDPENPGLSVCGASRAENLAKLLADAGLESIYSTDYERTLATAGPIAGALSLEVEIYDPENLESISRTLLNRRQNALVVGHSNTTGILAGILTSGAQEELDEDMYDRLYQVVISGEKSRLNLLHQAFVCNG